MNTRNALTLSLMIAAIVGASVAAQADTAWQKKHPRREEVNSRLARQNMRIHKEVKEGDMTTAQAKDLHAQDHAIRQEERSMAATDGGHITKAEKKALNQQENQVSKEIGK
jgi:hypothetical protein